MNKQELIQQIADRAPTRYPRTVIENVVEILGRVTFDAVKAGDEVTIPGLVRITSVETPARQARNPRTGDIVQIPARRKLKFKAVASVTRELK